MSAAILPPPTGVLAAEVIALVRAHTAAVPPTLMDLEEACGGVLREAVVAPEDQPAFDRSAMDGYAVRLDDPGPTHRIVDRIRAGEWKPRPLAPGEAVQVATGAALPNAGLRVIPKELVRLGVGTVEILQRTDSRHIRFQGEAARRGQELLPPGSLLSPGALSLLASLGCVRPLVSRPLRVTHLVTGNEIVPPDRTPGPGQIRDSNSVLVRSFLRAWKLQLTQRPLPEDEALVEQEAARPSAGVANADLLLVSGGASVGEHDFTRRLLEGLGFAIHLAKTNTRPGKPLLFGVRGASLAFGLPGNPLAHFVCLNLFVRAALDALTGAPASAVFREGTLATAWQDEPSPRETLWPARLDAGGRTVALTPLPWTSSGDLTPLANANAILRIPPDSPALPAGTAVSHLPLA